MGERIFHVILRKGQDHISLADYVAYYDVVYHGQKIDKDLHSFKMLDLSGTGHVTYETYTDFWRSFITMYGTMMNVKITFDAQMKEATEKAFGIISQGAPSFDFDRF